MALLGARTTLPLSVLVLVHESFWNVAQIVCAESVRFPWPVRFFTARHVAGGSVLALDGEPPGQRDGPAGVKGARASTGEGERRGGRGSPRSGRVCGAFGEERWSGSRDAGGGK